MEREEIDPQQIIRMQERITYLEKTVEDLSDVLIGLQERMSQWQRQIEQVRSQQELQDHQGPAGDANETPPHYGLPRSVPPRPH
jgi:uncharacterized coiled-coil protein SlyX